MVKTFYGYRKEKIIDQLKINFKPLYTTSHDRISSGCLITGKYILYLSDGAYHAVLVYGNHWSI